MTEDLLPGFKIGADPELFLFDTDRDKFVSAEGLLPGTKENPHKVPCGAVQVDGMAAEFNINPAETFAEFTHNIGTVLMMMKSLLPSHIRIVGRSAVVFDEDVWDETPDVAKILGCNPDFNAWTGSVNPPPKDTKNPRLRTASGHLHIGWTEGEDGSDDEHLKNCRDLVKQMDYHVGYQARHYDSDTTRRRLYGKAGAMRYKPYGVEYRVLSNFWVLSSSLQQIVWNWTCRALGDMANNYLPDQNPNADLALQRAINSGKASTVVKQFCGL